MKILVFDLETTGLLEDQGSVITEMAWATWDPIKKRVYGAKSFLVNMLAEGEEVTPEITALTGIDTEMVTEEGCCLKDVWKIFEGDLENVDAMAARNGTRFDKPMLVKCLATQGVEWQHELMPLVDDCLDVNYPLEIRGTTQNHIAADHGFLNPFPHTGLGDVLTWISIMERGGYCMQEAIYSARTPVVRVIANVSYQDKDLAKNEKFRWEPTEKIWYKDMRQSLAEATTFGFPTDTRETR